MTTTLSCSTRGLHSLFHTLQLTYLSLYSICVKPWGFSRYAFSKNNRPTMEPIPNPNVPFGQATQMSKNDIDRLNRLYQCCEESLFQSL